MPPIETQTLVVGIVVPLVVVIVILVIILAVVIGAFIARNKHYQLTCYVSCAGISVAMITSYIPYMEQHQPEG